MKNERAAIQGYMKMTIKGRDIYLTMGDFTFYVLLDILLIFVLVMVAVPMWSVITLSFRPNDFIGSNLEGMFLPPWMWSTAAYKALLGNNGFLNSFLNSLKIFVFGVATSLFLTIPLAYVLSVKTLPGRKFLNILILLPYLFNVGIIPAYLVVTKLGLTNHLAAIFLPTAISTYNCLIMRRFFEGIPDELKESARIDGASELRVLLSIVLPVSKPILLTIGLYYGVTFWNDFFHAMLYLNNNNLQPLPILLRNILMASGMNEFVEVSAFGNANVQAIKAASVFMSAIPMIIAYPFIQKYFTKGTMLGSVKG
jgi:putative aldouronate transport system permease protein